MPVQEKAAPILSPQGKKRWYSNSLGTQVPLKEIAHLFPCEPLPETVLCKGVLVKTGIAHQTPFVQPQEDETPRVVIRKPNNFTDKLKAWEAAGETG